MEYLPEQQLISAWNRFWRWYDKRLGDRRWPEVIDICTRGADFGVRIPQPELVLRSCIAHGSSEWRLQLCGAALYWHLASVAAGRASVESDAKPLTGLDVLEVACLRGGGARYLAKIAGPRSYVATEGSIERVEVCRRRHIAEAPDLLQFQQVPAEALSEHFPASSFDLVISVEPGDRIGESPHAFAAGIAQVLRPGGKLLLCDMLSTLRWKQCWMPLQKQACNISAKIYTSQLRPQELSLRCPRVKTIGCFGHSDPRLSLSNY